MTHLKDLIHIPEQVNRGDFVLNLAEGVQNPEQTVKNYVVTEQLADAFDDALTFMRSVYDEARPKSKATYLHGSFGSGKSHFMAILSLLLSGHETVRNKERLQPVVVKHDWSRNKKFLLVPLHMIGKASMEQGILGGYTEFIAKQHPNAPLPAFFRATEILTNARDLRATMGDEAFFAKLNTGKDGGGDDAWGDYGGSWDATSFDTAANQKDPLHDDQRRLVSDIVTHLITSLRNQGDFVDLDHGLVAMSHHAKDLGYDGIVLFLDELVLWLMSRSADPQFIASQGPKIANLVEGKIANAVIPVISFIARQRDLREALGDSLTGSTHKAMSQTMDWWDERFHKITLEDRNLPVIARERLLRPLNDDAKSEIDAAFAATTRVRQDVIDVLLTAESSKEAFRDLYPFSPALVQALVAVSGQLQRDRTALRILLQMLASERDTLELGTVVPVGDLWDYIIGENFSANLRAQADTARRLWDEHFQPLLLGDVGLPPDAEMEALVKDQANAVPLRNFRMRARIVKTLLLAALVPGVPSLTNLTARKLAALNHGTIQSPIPNQEGRTILTWLRTWAGSVEKLKLTGDANDPMISIELSDIDTMAIIRDAQGEDNHGNRKRLLQETLYRELGIQLTDTLFHSHKLEWRGCPREFEIRFRNIRLSNAEDLKAPADKWVIVIDYPFDEDPQQTPADDVAKLQDISRKIPDGSRTIVWLPNFFSNQTKRNLGHLVIIRYLLQGDRLDGYTGHLNAKERAQARELLENRQQSLERELVNALEVAYGVSMAPENAIDRHFAGPANQLRTLAPGFTIQPPDASKLQTAMERLLTQALEFQYPAAPEVTQGFKRANLKRVAEFVEKAVASGRERVDGVDHANRAILGGLAQPLGLATINQDVFALKRDWREHFQRQMAASGSRQPTVAELREWCDLPNARGLPQEVRDLLIWSYALAADCRFIEHGAAVDVGFDNLSSNMELRQQELPSEDIWSAARERAGHLFGFSGPSLCNAATVAAAGTAIVNYGRENQAAAADLVAALREAHAHLSVDAAGSERYASANAAAELLARLKAANGDDAIRLLAEADLPAAADVVAHGVATAGTVKAAIYKVRWSTLKNLLQAEGHVGERARSLRERLATALTHEQRALDLAGAIADVDRDLERLLVQAAQTKKDEDKGAGGQHEEDARLARLEAERMAREADEARRREEAAREEARQREEASRLEQQRLRQELEEERRRREEAEKRAEAATEPVVLVSGSAEAGQALNERLQDLAAAHPGKRIRVIFELVDEGEA